MKQHSTLPQHPSRNLEYYCSLQRLARGYIHCFEKSARELIVLLGDPLTAKHRLSDRFLLKDPPSKTQLYYRHPSNFILYENKLPAKG